MSFFLLRKLLEKVRSAVNATRDHPSELAASYQVIRGLAQQRSWLELEKACREILDEKTETPEVWVLLAYSLQQQGRHAESVEFATRAAKLLPSQWHPNFLAGVALKAVGKNSEACENLKRAAAIFPEDEQTRRELLEAQAASESIVAAVSAYSAACSQTENPQSIVAATIHTIDTWISLSGAAVPSNRAVEEIANVRIFSGSNLLISSDGCAIMDNNEPTQYGSVVIAKEIEIVLLDTGKFHNREIETGAYLCGPTSSDPDYWMLAFLPKLELLRQHAHFMDVPIIVDADMPQSHFDQLAKLVSNPLILLEPSESISCQRLLVAACPEFLPLLEKIHEVRKLEQQKNWIKLEEHCREILAEHSAMTEPMALLAYSMQQQGRLSDAAELATRATALMPTSWLAN